MFDFKPLVVTISQYREQGSTFDQVFTFENYQRTNTVNEIGFCYSILTTPFDSNYKPYGFGLEYWSRETGTLYPYFKIDNNTIYWFHYAGIIEDFTTNRSGVIYYYWAIG